MTAARLNSIALLIDAVDFVLSELAAHGVVNIRRACGNWTKSSPLIDFPTGKCRGIMWGCLRFPNAESPVWFVP